LRLYSVKRKNPPGSQSSYANAVSGAKTDIPVPDPDEEKIDAGIAKVKSLCEKVNVDLQNKSLPPLVVTIFATLSEAVLGIWKNQQHLKDKKFGSFVPVTGNNKKNLMSSGNTQGNATKRSSNDSRECEYVDLATLRIPSQSNMQNRRRLPDLEPDPDPATKRFKEAISDA
jgi:hypothetical protein